MSSQVYTLIPGSQGTKELVQQMLMHGDYRAIIDVGALFKGVSNEEVAQVLATHFRSLGAKSHVRKVLYFNGEDELCALSVDGRRDVIGTTHNERIIEKTGCSPRELFTYYDQRHTTGTDIRQDSTALHILKS